MWLQRLLLLVLIAASWCRLSFGQSTLDVSGRVLDCSDSRPVAGASIKLHAAPNMIITDADGRFAIFGLKAGTYRLDLEAPAYYPIRRYQLTVNEDFSAEYTICLQPRIHFAEPQRVHARTDPDRHRTIMLDRRSPEFKSSGSMAELLETIPELVVSFTGGKSGEATVSVNGGPSKEVLVLVDGVSINSPITGVADINSVSLGNVSRIEFKRGSGSSQFGAGAVGGVLNIITKAPSEISGYGASGSIGALHARSWQNSANVRLAERGSISALYSGSAAANDFMFDNENREILRRENADIRRIYAGLSAEAGLAGYTSLGMTYNRFDQQNGLPGLVHWLNPVARKDEARNILSISSETDRGNQLRKAAYSYKHDSQVFQDMFEFSTVKSHGEYIDELHQLNLETGVRLPRDSRIDLSVTAARERFSSHNLLAPERPMFDDVVERRAAAAMSVGKGWTAYEGDHGCGANMQLRLRSDYSNLFRPVYSPSIHLGTSISRWIRVRGEVSYGKSYRAPLYSSLFWNDGVLAIGNPNLQPERLEESSAGLSLSLPVFGELEIEALYRHSAYRDLIYWSQTFDNKFTPRNLSGSVVFARIVNVHWAFRPLRLTAAYSNTDQIAKDRSWIRTHHNLWLTFRPRFTQHFSIRHSSKYVDLLYRLRHVSKRFIRAANTKWLDGYTVADFTAAIKYELRSLGIRVQYDLNNITDSEYMLIERYPMPGQLWNLSVRLTFRLGTG